MQVRAKGNVSFAQIVFLLLMSIQPYLPLQKFFTPQFLGFWACSKSRCMLVSLAF
jgi:hypothetical protein